MNPMWFVGLLLLNFSTPLLAAATLDTTIDQKQQQLHQQRLENLQQSQLEQQRAQPTQLEIQALAKYDLRTVETPCFNIGQISINSDAGYQFQKLLRQTLRYAKFKSGLCLGTNGVSYVANVLQNKIIAAGYITTRVLVPEQDLGNGKLQLQVMVGRVNEVKYIINNQAGFRNIQPHNNAFAISSGDILNLKDIEQGLENLKRAPTVDASMRIEPADQANMSNIIIDWSQKALPYRLSTNIDDSGSKSTGKYQGGITVSVDNLFGLSDLFYVNLGRSIFNGPNEVDPTYKTKYRSNSHSYALHYSIPYGYWLAQVNFNGYQYNQAVAGYESAHGYAGKSNGGDISLSRVLYRSAARKTTLTAKAWVKSSRSYLNDTEIPNQRKKTGGWETALEHKEYFGRNTLIGKLSYRRGTGFWHAMRAPEEQFVGEGTTRMAIINLDINLINPFSVAAQNFVYDTRFKAQWNRTDLLVGDNFAIGGRYSVRGFNGEHSLSAPRGWSLTNDLTWHYMPSHGAYIGLDVERVSKTNEYYPSRKSLVGMVLGLKGQLTIKGNLNYEFFLGKTLKQPTTWQENKWLFGFSLNHSF